MRRPSLLALCLLSFPVLTAAQSIAGGPPASATTTASGQAPATAVPSAPAPGAPIPSLPSLPEINKEAFTRMKTEMMPLSEDQIRELSRAIDASQRAAAEPPRFVPKAVTTSTTASMSPGSSPPVIRLFANYISNVMFIDEAGNPLSVTDVDVPGDSKSGPFNVTWSKDKDGRTNGLTISPNQMYAMGNLGVHLEGVRTPISLMLVTGQREIDTRVDVRVAGVGGGRQGPNMPGAASSELQAFLDGVPPKEAKALSSSSSSFQVWSMNGQFYVRGTGEMTLISPAPLEQKRSADGTTIYVVPQVSPLLALSDGNPLSITVSGY